MIKVKFSIKLKGESEYINKNYSISLELIFFLIYLNVQGEISKWTIDYLISNYISEFVFMDRQSIEDKKTIFDVNILQQLLLFGLLARNFNPKTESDSTKNSILLYAINSHSYEVYTISEKFDKLMLWYELNNIKVENRIDEITEKAP